MDFIFMLTHHDKTVQNCLDVYDSLSGIGLKHVGFKDVGVDKTTLKELTRRIKADGSIAPYNNPVAQQVPLYDSDNDKIIGLQFGLHGGAQAEHVAVWISCISDNNS